MRNMTIGALAVAAQLIGSAGAAAQPGILLKYTFDDHASPTSNSGSLGHAYDGALQGNAAFVPFNSGWAVSLPGDIANNSVVLPGGDQSLLNIGDSDFSLFARFTTTYFNTSFSSLRPLIWKQSTGVGATYAMGVRQETGRAQFSIADGVNFLSVFSSVPVNDGLVHEVIGARCGNAIRLYLDGCLDATLVIPGNFQSTHNNAQLVIGGRTIGNNDDWVGLIDEVRVYDECFAGDNRPPVANAGLDQSPNEGAIVILEGSASADPDGGTLVFAWTQVAGPTVTLNLSDPLHPSFTAPIVAWGGETLTFRLVVTDGCQLPSDPDIVNVTVANVNHPPVARAGDDQAVAEVSPVTLNGSNSFDDDGDPLAYSWTQTAGPSVTLNVNDPVHPTFTAPFVGVVGETLVFELTVNDWWASDSDSVSILVENVNHPPDADAGLDQTRNEGAAVTLDGTASSDPDGDTLTYLWVQIGGPSVTLSNTASSTPSFSAPQVGAAEATLVFRLTVNDSYNGTDSDEVSIRVQDTNSPPACGLARPSIGELWPPNHKMVCVSILGVTDPENNQVTITILGVTQDEPINGLGDGDTAPDAVLLGSTVLLRSERSGLGNGRVYRVTFRADDGLGGQCVGQVTVCVPHDQGRNSPGCVDDGGIFNSLLP